MLYKKYIQHSFQSCKRKNPNLNYAAIAENLEIEPSYLSRFLTDDKVHFSDELLIRLAKQVQLSQEQMDHMTLLRDYDRCTDEERRQHLANRIRMNKVKVWHDEVSKMRQDIACILQLIDSYESKEMAEAS